MATPYTGDTWHIKTRNLVAGRTPIIDTTPSAAVTWTATHNGAAYETGALVWEAFGFENSWAGQITLPATPGTLKVKVTITAVVDGLPVRGTRQQSIQVV